MREFPPGDDLGGVLKELEEKGRDGAARFMGSRLSDATRRFVVVLVFEIAFDWSTQKQGRKDKSKRNASRKH